MSSNSLVLDAGPGPASLALASGLEPEVLSDAALLDAVAEVERAMSWAAALRARLIAAYAARSVVDPRSEAEDREMDWHRERLAAACQTSPHEAQVRCDTALALEQRLPATWSALLSGSLPWAQAVALARESAGLGPAESSLVERTVLADPRATSVRQVAQATRRAVAELRPDVPDQAAADAHARRALTFWPAEAGSRVLFAELPVDAAALVAAALEPLAVRTGADDDRSAEQRRADALIRLAAGDHPAPARVAVVMRGRQHGAVDGEELAPSVLRRLTCDADLTEHPVSSDGTVHQPGTIADVDSAAISGARPPDPGTDAHRRLPGAAMRRRLELRDQQCRFPGCPVAAERCHAHHLTHWADGGPTTDLNVIMVCPRHHHSSHEGGWSTTGDALHLVWHDKHGRTYSRPSATAQIPPWTSDPPMGVRPDPDPPPQTGPAPDLDPPPQIRPAPDLDPLPF